MLEAIDDKISNEVIHINRQDSMDQQICQAVATHHAEC